MRVSDEGNSLAVPRFQGFDTARSARCIGDSNPMRVSLDHARRPRQLWEASDGAVLLVRELAAAAPTAATEFLPTVAELAGLDGFAHCCHLQVSSDLHRGFPFAYHV